MKKQYSTQFKIHFTGASKGRRQTIAGVDYASYPAIILVEGVHHGAIGDPVMYTNEVLASYAHLWNGVPVTINHPKDKDGAYVSVTHPNIAPVYSPIGKLMNAKHEEGKTKAILLIDIKKANDKSPTLITDLDNGVEMQLSTGLFGAEDAEEGVWNNETYKGVLTEIHPDHLALLPGSVGACSWDDGCGVRANQTELTGPTVNQEKDDYLLNRKAALSHNEIRQKLEGVVSSMDKKRALDNGPFHFNWIVEVFDNYFIWESENQDGRGYFRQSYSLDANDNIVLVDDKTEVQKRTEYTPITANTQQKENDMKKKAGECCPDRVAALIANEATPYKAEDSEWITALTAEAFEKLEAPYKVQAKGKDDCMGLTGQAKEDCMEKNGTKKKANEGQPTPAKSEAEMLADYINSAPAPVRAVLNAGMRQLDAKRSELIGKIKANEQNTFTDEELMGMPDVILEKFAAAVAPPQKAPDYSGAGGGFVPLSSGETKEEAYVPLTLNFAKPVK